MSSRTLATAALRLAPLVVTLSTTLAPTLTAQGRPRFPPVPVPPGNPITASKALLGKALFFEEQMSSTKRVACATCHVLEKGGSDPRASLTRSIHPGADGKFNTADDVRGSLGVVGNQKDGKYRSTPLFGLAEQVTPRRSMSVINAVFSRALFWDGRASETFRDPLTKTTLLRDRGALESQTVVPVMNDVEMAHFGQSWSDIVSRLTAARPLALASRIPAALATFVGTKGYPDLFQSAFGTKAITPARIAMAIATYERTLISDRSPVDTFLGGSSTALTAQERRGEQLFRSRQVDCVGCHGGPLGTDGQFHYTGVTAQSADLGRYLVTNNNGDRGRMKTPSVRNVALRAPYFHDGSARTLAEVVEFYDRGGNFTAPNKDRRIRQLRLSKADKAALVAFLAAFTDPRVSAGTAPFDRPLLYTESKHVPQHYGAGTAGSQNIVPTMIAIEPPALGNSSLTVGVDGGHGGSPAVLVLDGSPSVSGWSALGAKIHFAGTGAMILLPTITLQGTGAGKGWGSQVLRVPAIPILRNAKLYAQWLVIDTGKSALAATDAVSLTIF